MNKLRHDLRLFVSERKWDGYHSPKNLSMALMVEAAEMVEIFQWMTEAESILIDAEAFERLKDEIGDVQIYLMMLADKFNLCPVEMARMKIKKNRIKHPVDDNRYGKFR